ncbi:MAG TPA: efflux RND transporter periplasmic adaptor subunit [Chitinophagales bacterium]|nr:efflux RND transporter periplasmic adaptor subunit [Chitinophagales bacterium]
MKHINDHLQINLHSKSFLPAVLLFSISAFFAGCENKTSSTVQEAVIEEHETHSEGDGNNVELTQQQFTSIAIQLGTIEQKNLSATLKTTGFLKVPPQNKASITSSTGGTVQHILVREGDYVQKGQTLLTIMNPQFVKMQQEYLDAQSQLVFTEADYQRQKGLNEKNVSSQKVFQQVTADYNSLKTTVNALRQQLALLNINSDNLTFENISSSVSIKSPISGNISHIEINIGSNIETSKSLMEIVDNSRLHVDLFVFEQDLSKVKEGQQVDLTLINTPGKNYTAKIFAVGNAFESETKTIPVHAEITGDKKGLIEGMNVTAFITTERNLVPAVPSTAIINNGGNDFIFIQTHGHEATKHDHLEEEHEDVKQEMGEVFTFERIPVKRGVTNGNFSEITSLSDAVLTENAKVVTNGAFYLMAMLTNSGGEGHAH